ncbi:MAG: hypothetical protein WCT18_03825 [Patescibacteria group bacterium]
MSAEYLRQLVEGVISAIEDKQSWLVEKEKAENELNMLLMQRDNAFKKILLIGFEKAVMVNSGKIIDGKIDLTEHQAEEFSKEICFVQTESERRREFLFRRKGAVIDFDNRLWNYRQQLLEFLDENINFAYQLNNLQHDLFDNWWRISFGDLQKDVFLQQQDQKVVDELLNGSQLDQSFHAERFCKILRLCQGMPIIITKDGQRMVFVYCWSHCSYYRIR